MEGVAWNGGGLDCLHGSSLPGCLWSIILLVPIFGLTQGPSWWVSVHPSVKMDSSGKVSGRLAAQITAWQLLPPLTPFLDWRPSPHMCGLGNPLDHKNEKNVVILSFTQSGLMLLLVPYLKVSAGDWQQLLSLGSIYLLPQYSSQELVKLSGILWDWFS